MNVRLERDTLLVGAGLALAVAAFLILVFLPQKRQIEQLHNELQTKRAAILEASLVPVQIERVERSIDEARAYLARHRGRVLNSPETAQLFGQLADVVKVGGATSTMFRPGESQRAKALTQVPVDLACRGQFEDVFGVLAGIERLRQPVWINEIHIERSKSDQDGVECRVNLAIFTVDLEISD